MKPRICGLHIAQDYEAKEELQTMLQELFYSESGTPLCRNSRNALYSVHLPGDGGEAMIKRSLPQDSLRATRYFSFYARNFFKHYGRRGFEGARTLQKCGIKSIEPIAYFKLRVGLLRYQSCFVYRKIPALFSIRDFLKGFDKNDSSHQALLVSLFPAMAQFTKSFHAKRLLHGDLVANNILVTLKGPLRASQEPEFELALIDTDHIFKNLFPTEWLRTFVSMRCFRRHSLRLETQELFLKLYFDSKYRRYWLSAVRFWGWLDRRPLSQLRYKLFGKNRGPKKQVYPRLEAAQDELLQHFSESAAVGMQSEPPKAAVHS